jgi:hypothetical protein
MASACHAAEVTALSRTIYADGKQLDLCIKVEEKVARIASGGGSCNDPTKNWKTISILKSDQVETALKLIDAEDGTGWGNAAIDEVVPQLLPMLEVAVASDTQEAFERSGREQIGRLILLPSAPKGLPLYTYLPGCPDLATETERRFGQEPASYRRLVAARHEGQVLCVDDPIQAFKSELMREQSDSDDAVGREHDQSRNEEILRVAKSLERLSADTMYRVAVRGAPGVSRECFDAVRALRDLGKDDLAQELSLALRLRQCDPFGALEEKGAGRLAESFRRPWVLQHAITARPGLFEMPSGNTVTVIEVQGAFEDGVIKDLTIRCELDSYADPDSGREVEFRAAHPISVQTPLAIQRLNTPFNNIATWRGEQVSYSLDVADVIEYRKRVVAGSADYSPQNGPFRLTPEAPETELYKNPFQTRLDVRLYTDVTGFQGENPNGLLQVEGQYTAFTRVDRLGRFESASGLILLNWIRLYALASRTEEEDTVVKPDSLNRVASVQFLRQERWNAGVAAGLFRVEGNHQALGFNVRAGVAIADVDTSGTNANRIRNVTAWNSGLECRYEFTEGSRLDIDVATGIDYLTVRSDVLDNVGRERIFRFEGGLSFHPGGFDRSRSIFLRGIHYYTSRASNNTQFHIGYAAPITKFFGGERP